MKQEKLQKVTEGLKNQVDEIFIEIWLLVKFLFFSDIFLKVYGFSKQA